jgi:hypothetical protein
MKGYDITLFSVIYTELFCCWCCYIIGPRAVKLAC